MKKLIFLLAVLSPVMVFSQDVNSTKYNDEGTLLISYSGEDDGNYRFIKYYENGNTASIGQYKNGEKHGVWKSWNEDGKVAAVAHYKNGNKTGKWIINDAIEHTTFEINFNDNHVLHALKKDNHGHIIAKR